MPECVSALCGIWNIPFIVMIVIITTIILSTKQRIMAMAIQLKRLKRQIERLLWTLHSSLNNNKKKIFAFQQKRDGEKERSENFINRRKNRPMRRHRKNTKTFTESNNEKKKNTKKKQRVYFVVDNTHGVLLLVHCIRGRNLIWPG